MRILWHSAPPWSNTGYGRCTREIGGRIHGEDHEVIIHPTAGVDDGPIHWHGEQAPFDLHHPMTIMPSSGGLGMGNVVENFDKTDSDFYLTHFDTWMNIASQNIPEMGIPYGSYIILDHDPVPKKVTNQIMNAHRTFTMSKWAKHKLNEKGVRSKQIPHGVDTGIYQPVDWSSEDVSPTITCQVDENKVREVDVRDTFIVGMVAANHGDRKRIPIQMQAFKRFIDEVDDEAIMYVHTDVQSDHGHDLEQVRKELGLPRENLMWADQNIYHELDDIGLNVWYNAFDVLLNCSQGESWGLTITEAMAAGTPAIVTDFSSMPEQLGVPVEGDGGKVNEFEWGYEAPHGLCVYPSVGIWRERVAAKQMVVSPDDVFKALEYYHDNPDLVQKHSKNARSHTVENYDWQNCILPKWKEQFDQLEELLL